jgi:ankyrin repeat protein
MSPCVANIILPLKIELVEIRMPFCTTPQLILYTMDLFHASEYARIIQYLQTDPFRIDEYDRNYLHYAMMYKEASLDSIFASLIHGINPNQIDCIGDTPLTLLLKSSHDSAKILQCLELLLIFGADPNLHSPGTVPPLLLAAIMRNFGAMLLLIQHGANINCRFKAITDTIMASPTSALSFAVEMNDRDMVKILMKSGLMSAENVFHALQKASPEIRPYLLKAT